MADYNGKRGDVSPLGQCVRRCHDLVKTHSKSSHRHNHIYLHVCFFCLLLLLLFVCFEHFKALSKVSMVLISSWNKLTPLNSTVFSCSEPNRIQVPIDELRQKAFSLSISDITQGMRERSLPTECTCFYIQETTLRFQPARKSKS